MAYPGNHRRRALRRPRRSGRKRVLPPARVQVSPPSKPVRRGGGERPRPRRSEASQGRKGASKRERRQSRGINKAVVSGLVVSLFFKLMLLCLAAATWLLVGPRIQAIQVQIPALP